MAEFEKIGKVIDSKLKAFASVKEKSLSQNKGKESVIEQLSLEENEFFLKLGKNVFEREKDKEASPYQYLIKEIINKQQLISEELQKKTRKTCSKCGAAVSDTAIFCTACGKKIEPTSEKTLIICPECGGQITEESEFCDQCGTKL